MMKFVKDYMRDETLRHELNELTRETFGFDFENWVTGGFFEGDYIPYSFEENGQIIANVSANHMEFWQNGTKRNYIQIGTVMTKVAYRKKGYARELLKMVLADYEGKCDGIYLYGNPDALGFYDKLGFERGLQYRYTLKDSVRERFLQETEKIDKTDKKCGICLAQGDAHKLRYRKMVRDSVVNSALEQVNKYGLQMFYTADMEQVYYVEALDCYIALEMQGDTLHLQSIISDKKVSTEQIVKALPMDYKQLILGFTPCWEEADLFDEREYDGEDDYRFFFRGEALKSIEAEKLYFPEFSHA